MVPLSLPHQPETRSRTSLLSWQSPSSDFQPAFISIQFRSFFSCFSVSFSLCIFFTSVLILFPSDTILPHLPTPSLHYVKKKSHNSSPHLSLHFDKISIHVFKAQSIKTTSLISLFKLRDFICFFYGFNLSVLSDAIQNYMDSPNEASWVHYTMTLIFPEPLQILFF